MGILRNYFGHIFQFNEDKDAINMCTTPAAIAAILAAADARDNQHDIAVNAGNDSDSLFTPYLAKLRNHAVEHATDLGLAGLGLYNLRNETLRLMNRIDSAISSANLDLYSDNAGLSAIASICIHDAHHDVNSFITLLAGAPQAAFDIAPALATLKNTNSDADIEKDRIWDMVDFLNHFTRAQIRDNFVALRADLANAVSAFDRAAIAHLQAQDSASMATICGAVTKTDAAPKPPKP